MASIYLLAGSTLLPVLFGGRTLPWAEFVERWFSSDGPLHKQKCRPIGAAFLLEWWAVLD
jgi:hypothetical protein